MTQQDERRHDQNQNGFDVLLHELKQTKLSTLSDLTKQPQNHLIATIDPLNSLQDESNLRQKSIALMPSKNKQNHEEKTQRTLTACMDRLFRYRPTENIPQDIEQ